MSDNADCCRFQGRHRAVALVSKNLRCQLNSRPTPLAFAEGFPGPDAALAPPDDTLSHALEPPGASPSPCFCPSVVLNNFPSVVFIFLAFTLFLSFRYCATSG